MKNLVDILIKESRGWEMAGKGFGGPDFSWKASKPFMWIGTEGERIGFMSEEDIKAFAEDFDEDELNVNDILNLEPGEMFDADGGLNLYIRIK